MLSDEVSEVLILPTRYFYQTVQQVTESRTLVFNPVASLRALMMPPKERTSQEFQASLNYASKCLQFFRQLPLIATKPLLERCIPKIVLPNTVILREGE